VLRGVSYPSFLSLMNCGPLILVTVVQDSNQGYSNVYEFHKIKLEKIIGEPLA
jgi:hypothetical protein